MRALNVHIPFMKIKIWGLGVSLVLCLASGYLLMTKGLNYGVDFEGGVKMIYKFQALPSEDGLRQVLQKAYDQEISIVRFGNPEDSSYLIRMEGSLGESINALATRIEGVIAEAFGQENVQLSSVDAVGPAAGEELRRKSEFAIILSLILMLIYIAYRFDILFAPGAVLSLGHDVLITLGLFSLLGKDFNLSILAAVLAIVGYSINDTIVIYDRVREKIALGKPEPLEVTLDQALNETLSRTIITSLTVFLAVLALYFFGGGVVHDFAVAMICGVIVGSYSTLFVASPVYLWLTKILKRTSHFSRAR